MNAVWRFAWPLLITLVGLTGPAGTAGAASDGEPGLLPLDAGDLSSPVRAPVCEVRIRAVGSSDVLLSVLDGSTGFGSFSPVSAQESGARLPAHKVVLPRTSREKLGNGRYVIRFSGSLPPSGDSVPREVYAVTLEVERSGPCRAAPSHDCAAYRGTLSTIFRLRSDQGRIEERVTTPRPVEFEERCPAETYRVAGLFFFPGWLDRLGGWLLRSR